MSSPPPWDPWPADVRPDPPYTAALTAQAAPAVRGAGTRAGFWRALALELLGLLGFVLLFNLLLPSLGSELGTPARAALGLLMALLPALLWLGIFLAIDQRDPEPKQLVLRTLVAGALVYAALAGPLLYGLFAIDEWLHTTLWSRLLGGVLVVGVVEQAIVYIAVRYTIFERPEFNERVDGVIYGVAAGLGVATVVNFGYVLERGGVDLGIGSLRMVINTLAYGAIAGLLGAFMGQSRFERKPIWYLPAGLTAAALLNGLLFFLLESGDGGLQAGSAWGDLALAAAVAVLALATVFAMLARTPEAPLTAPALPRVPESRTPEPRRRAIPGFLAPAPIAAALDEPKVVAEVDTPDAERPEDGAPEDGALGESEEGNPQTGAPRGPQRGAQG